MFKKILIANRGDNGHVVAVAAQTHVGGADVMSEPNRRLQPAQRASTCYFAE